MNYRSNIMKYHWHCTGDHPALALSTPTDYRGRGRGIRSKRRQVGSATNKTATRRNGDNSVISATDKVNMTKKQQVKTATTIEEEGRAKKSRGEEGRKIITN